MATATPANPATRDSSSTRIPRPARPTRVLVVDDSALIRQLLTEILGNDPRLEVVGSACDPYAAWDKITTLEPDVLTLDVEMPHMNGLTFLEKLMAKRPMPVVMISSLTERGAETTLRALELGAVDFVAKPKFDVVSGTVTMADEIVDKVRAAAGAKVRPTAPRAIPARPAAAAPSAASASQPIVAIGTSTGGTAALHEVLTHLPADAPGIVAVIHMPENFTRTYAQRLDSECKVRVREAKIGDRIVPGQVLLAPGNRHMTVVRQGPGFAVALDHGDPVNRHRPSVDVLFASCGRVLGNRAVGVLLTGMGADGAGGLLAMRGAGSRTLVQDEATCVVFGMPREAIALGAAEEVLPLERIAGRILEVGRVRG
ncbi:MAG TPA: chemotaxis response regulator protein-glutamate methylesterase [Gemmataceae bacterium]|nr:chemotaxis response regulator protein-glutamate methylesterase [Gemmataceae bacterium]